MDPDRVARQLTAAGLDVTARLTHAPELPHERSPQVALFAVRSG